MHELVAKEVTRVVYTMENLSCDLCGYSEDPTFIFPLVVTVDEDGCAGTRITRDVCRECYDEKIEPVINPLFDVLKAGDEVLTEGQEDRWYG